MVIEQTPQRRRAHVLRSLRPYALMAPAMLLVAAVSFLPLVQSVVQSLHRANYLDMGEFIGLLNYQRFLLSEAGIQRTWNSFVFVVGSLAITMPLGFALAMLLNLPLRARGLIRTVLIIPWLVSNTVAAILWAWILSAQFGPISPMITALGFTMPNPLTSESLAMPAQIGRAHV